VTPDPEIDRLRARVAALEDELAEWARRDRADEAQAEQVQRTASAQWLLGMTRLEAVTLLQLLDRSPRLVTRASLVAGRPLWAKEDAEDKIVEVYLSKVRTKLRRAGITEAITTCWGSGWFLTEAGARQVRERLGAR